MRTGTNGKHVDEGHTDMMQYLDQPFLWSGISTADRKRLDKLNNGRMLP